MTTITPIKSQPVHRTFLARHAQAVAWLVVLASFIIFCAICALSTFGAYWFFFESRLDLTVTLQSNQGSTQASFADGSQKLYGANNEPVERNTILLVNEGSQALVTFEDNYSHQLIGQVFLLASSNLSLDRGSRPRFEWSRTRYNIDFSGVTGHLIVYLPIDVVRPTTFTFEGPFGSIILERPGWYKIDTSEEQLSLYAYTTPGILKNAAGALWQVPPNQYASITRANQIASVQPFPFLVLNENFGRIEDVATKPGLPVGWICSNETALVGEIQGVWKRALEDGQLVLSMIRQGTGLNHAESSCRYDFRDQDDPQQPLNIRNFTSLSIRSMFKIKHQDVTTCGDQGTECPVMLELIYLVESTNDKGEKVLQEYAWRHGFYAVRPESDQRPLSCDTCLQVHERVYEGHWFFYESGDLLSMMPPERRPLYLKSIRVYSSGHAYEMVMSTMNVQVGTVR